MFTVVSSTITENDKAIEAPLLEWKFQISNGNTGEVVISDPLLDTQAKAEERAKSEFLKSSYKIKEIRFSTYLTSFTKNQVINVRGLPYLIKSISTSVDKVSVKTNIRAIRYQE